VLRVAVIGVGSLGQHHARLLATLAGVRLVAVVDRAAARAAAIAERTGCAALSDHDGLEGIHAVTVAVPTTDHVRVASDCLRRGFDVLVEKPMADSVAEAEGLVRLAAEADRVLAVGHTERFNPVVRAALARLRRPRFIEAHRLGVFSARSTDVDVVLDLMIHDIDISLRLVGRPIEAIDAVGVNALTPRVDIANARIRFAGGCVANLTASRISTDKVRKLRVFESDAYLSLDYANQDGLVYGLRPTAGGRPEIVRESLSVQNEEPLLAELRAFTDRAAGRGGSIVSGSEGVEALRAARAILDQIARATAENAG
jgi:predicted dehydrogenase